MGKTSNTAATETGTCQICERACKIVRGLISLHGYNRPGDGFITGRCPGAKRLPLEVACDALVEHVSTMADRVANCAEALARWTTFAGDEITVYPIYGGRPLAPVTHKRGELTVNSWGCTVEEFKFALIERQRTAGEDHRAADRYLARQGARLVAAMTY